MVQKKTKRVLVLKSDSDKAQRVLLITVGLLIWFNAITTLAILWELFKYLALPDADYVDLDPLVSVLILTIFSSFIIGVYAILKLIPPLHYFIPFGAGLNLFISVFAGVAGYPQGLMSFIVLYISFRFPIRFEWEKQKLQPN